MKSLKFIKKILIFDELASTNDYALELEKLGEPSGVLVIAKKQSHGRGRLKRSWHTGEGDIAMSLLLREPNIAMAHCSLLAWVPALAVCDALGEFNISLKIKWPNDIVIKSNINYKYFKNYEKIGGILVENIFKDQKISASILGLGLNIKFNKELKENIPHAGFLAQAKPGLKDEDILPILLEKLDKNLCDFNSALGATLMRERYLSLCASIDQEVEVEISNHIIHGRVVGLTNDGFLIIKSSEENHIIYSGDVNFIN